MKKLFKYSSLCVVFFVLGGLAVNFYWMHRDNGYAALVGHPELLKQILHNSHAKMINDECFFENEESSDFYVSDYLLRYFRHFSNPGIGKYSGIAECGFIDDNVCELVFGERNVEGDKGFSRHLRFSIDPVTKLINPETFVCWGF